MYGQQMAFLLESESLERIVHVGIPSNQIYKSVHQNEAA